MDDGESVSSQTVLSRNESRAVGESTGQLKLDRISKRFYNAVVDITNFVRDSEVNESLARLADRAEKSTKTAFAQTGTCPYSGMSAKN
jgi:hypothetical protein